MKQIEVFGHDELNKKLLELPKDEVIIYFVGTKLEETGKSWCSDCVKAEPSIEETLLELKHLNVIFLVCNVGNKEEWNNPNNPIKMDDKFGVKCIPTMVVFNVEKGFVGKEKLDKDEDFMDSGNVVSFIVSSTY